MSKDRQQLQMNLDLSNNDGLMITDYKEWKLEDARHFCITKGVSPILLEQFLFGSKKFESTPLYKISDLGYLEWYFDNFAKRMSKPLWVALELWIAEIKRQNKVNEKQVPISEVKELVRLARLVFNHKEGETFDYKKLFEEKYKSLISEPKTK